MNIAKTRIIKALYRTFLLMLGCFTLCLRANTLEVYPITSLAKEGVNQWQHIIANPSINKGYFLISQAGEFYTLNKGVLSSKPFFTRNRISPKAQQITAITLHPNFSLRDQVGFHTFYIAHIEAMDSTQRKNRIRGKGVDTSFDLIINEFQLIKNNLVDKDSQREILRIGVANKTSHVTQLAFNPFTKIWNEDFGLLYIALNEDTQHKKIPLYSGAILRINPSPFGLRNYTVPNNNPFVKQNNIHNELLVIGLQKVNRFIWPQKSEAPLLIGHQYNKQYLVTLANPKDNFQEHPPKEVLYRSSQQVNAENIVAYRGRELPHLWGSIMMLIQDNDQWKIQTFIPQNSSGKVRAPIVEWQYKPANVNDKGPLIFIQNDNHEISILNKANQQFSQLATSSTVKNKPNTGNSAPARSDSQGVNIIQLVITLVIVITAIVFYITFSRRRHSARKRINQQYSAFKVSTSKAQVSLFKHHHKIADVILNSEDIIEHQLSLNDIHLNTINEQQPFSNKAEIDVREQVNNERRNKMTSNRIRQLHLDIVDKKGHKYPIYSYLRKGDNRITRKKFSESVEEAINLCWILSEIIAPLTTEKRTSTPVEAHNHNAKNHTQQSLKKANISNRSSNRLANKTLLSTEPKEPTSTKNNNGQVTSIPNQDATTPNGDSTTNPSPTINTELINALEKLANLKQQGALTEQEFEQAKHKVLEGLLK